MPIYEFRCQDCGEQFEELVSATEESVPCPKCQSPKTGRIISLISSKGMNSACNSCSTSSCKTSSGFT